MVPLFVTNHVDLIVMQAAYIIWFLPELIYTFTKTTRKDAQLHDRFSKFSVMGGIYLGIATALGFAFAARPFSIPWHRTFIFAVGIFLILAGTALRWYAVRILGKYFTLQVAIQPEQTVVESGPYRWVRHPSYTGSLLSLLGFGLILSNWLSLLSVLFFAILGYSYRIWVEETALLNALGEPYREYMKRTKRIIPFMI
jgi:protein-S-isoprenylcysteine O-methyltransferase Ste14